MRRRGAERPWIHGLVAAFLAVMFVGTGAIDAYGLHDCPHHDALPDAASSAQPVAGGHGASGHAAPAGHDDGHDEHGPCTCIGLCGAASVALPALGAGAPELVVATAGRVAARPVLTRVPTRGDYLLPFATAPPFAR